MPWRPANWSMPRPATLIRVDADERTAGQGWPADFTVIGDAALAADALATRVAPRDPWADQVFRVRHDIRTGLAATRARPRQAPSWSRSKLGGPRAPTSSATWPWRAIGSAATPACRAAAACSTPSAGARSASPYPLRSALLLGLGAALSWLRVTAGSPCARRVGHADQEQLPVTVLVVDDDGYGMLRFDRRVDGDAARGVDLGGPVQLALAEAFGLPARALPSVGTPLRDALAEAATSAGPNLLHVKASLYPPRPHPRDGTSSLTRPHIRASAENPRHDGVTLPRILTILGSGETSPTMVTPHQQVFAQLGSEVPRRVLGHPVRLPGERRRTDATGPDLFRRLGRAPRPTGPVPLEPGGDPTPASTPRPWPQLLAARWVFAGPGSPSYALRHWAGSAVPAALNARLAPGGEGGAVVFGVGRSSDARCLHRAGVRRSTRSEGAALAPGT